MPTSDAEQARWFAEHARPQTECASASSIADGRSMPEETAPTVRARQCAVVPLELAAGG